MKKLFTMIVLALVIVGFSAVGSEAGVKNIRLDQLKVVSSTYNWYQYPSNLMSGDSNECFWSGVVKLPVGKRITKLIYYHKGQDSSASTNVTLFRIKTGQDSEPLASKDSTDDTNAIVPVETTEINTPRVKNGYTYFITVYSRNEMSIIFGIKIFYK